MWKETPEGIILSVKISTKASRSEVVGEEGEELKLRIAAVPEKGKANAEIIRLLSKKLKIGKSQITILIGETSRHKKLLLRGITSEEMLQKFLE